MTVVLTSGSEAGLSTTTDTDGDYTLGGFSQQSVTLSVRSPQYETVEATTSNARQDFTMLRKECQNSSCSPSPIGCNEKMPMLRLPFNGDRPVSAVFDHTTPFLDASDGEVVSFCGSDAAYDGHSGWDFPMPTGTPIVAAARGEVIFAGKEDPFFCPFLDKNVAGNSVVIAHTSPNGEEIFTLYAHFKEWLVEEGETVAEGKKIGLSGNTGCSTGPHLHFEVVRRMPGPNNNGSDNAFSVDPMGWQGIGRDPWAVDPEGAVSVWMWMGPIGATSVTAPPTRDMHNISIRDLARGPIIK